MSCRGLQPAEREINYLVKSCLPDTMKTVDSWVKSRSARLLLWLHVWLWWSSGRRVVVTKPRALQVEAKAMLHDLSPKPCDLPSPSAFFCNENSEFILPSSVCVEVHVCTCVYTCRWSICGVWYRFVTDFALKTNEKQDVRQGSSMKFTSLIFSET